jgi:hypothetical protein
MYIQTEKYIKAMTILSKIVSVARFSQCIDAPLGYHIGIRRNSSTYVLYENLVAVPKS